MISYLEKKRRTIPYRTFSGFLAVVFLLTVLCQTNGYAQTVLNLPVPGTMVTPSQAYVPVLLKGMTIHAEDPFRFDFIVDSGNSTSNQEQLKEESERLVKYFLAALTVPKDDLWVNLSPFEKDRIIPEELGKTELGRDMLAQDYILKQLTASLIYPEKELGKEFWDRLKKKAYERYGVTDIPADTFNKVWIVPDRVIVYENGDTVFVTESRLKVMLEEDYLARDSSSVERIPYTVDGIRNTEYGIQMSNIIKELIIPEIEHEVNTGKNFAPLRQIFHSLILAKWYKETITNSLLAKAYVNQNKIAGVDVKDKTIKDQIYNQYIAAYKKGVFNYIKEDYDRLSNQTIPRKYFSGGMQLDLDFAMTGDPSAVDLKGVGTQFKFGVRTVLLTTAMALAGSQAATVPASGTMPLTPAASSMLQQSSSLQDQREFLRAADRGDLKGVKRLLRKGVDVNIRDANGWTALLRASLNGHTKVVQFLLKQKNIDVNAMEIGGHTPLMLAARRGHDEVVKLLLEQQGINVDAVVRVEDESYTALTLAMVGGHNGIVMMLIQHPDTDVNRQEDKIGLSLLMLAASEGLVEVVEALVAHEDTDIGLTNNDGQTALHIAAWNGHPDIVEILLKRHQDINAQDHVGYTSLAWAASLGHTDIVRLLLNMDGIDTGLKDKKGRTVEMVAVENGHTEIVELLQAHAHDDAMLGSKGMARGFFLTAALTVAGSQAATAPALAQPPQPTASNTSQSQLNDNESLVLELIRALRSIDEKIRKGAIDQLEQMDSRDGLIFPAYDILLPELINALINENTERSGIKIIRKILEERIGNDAVPYLLWALTDHGESSPVINTLEQLQNFSTETKWKRKDMKAEVDVLTLTKELLTAIDRKDLLAIQTFQDRDGAVNKFDSNGWTPLMHASLKGDDQIVRALLEKGANANNSSKKEGYTPLILAAYHGHDAVVRALIGAGANVNALDQDGRSALIKVVQAEHLSIVRILVEVPGIDLDIEDKQRQTALVKASRSRHPNNVDIMYALLAMGAGINRGNVRINVQNDKGESVLMLAAQEGNRDVVNTVLTHPDIEVDLEDNGGLTALDKASQNNHVRIMHALLAQGAPITEGTQVDAKNEDGETAFSLISHDTTINPDMRVNSMFQLIKAGARDFKDANLDIENDSGETVFKLISDEEGSADIMLELLMAGAENLKGAHLEPALLLAAERGNPVRIRKLIENGANVTATDSLGRTPLMLAAYYRRPNTLRVLLEGGADKTIGEKDNDGNTALMLVINSNIREREAERLVIIRELVKDNPLWRKPGGVGKIWSGIIDFSQGDSEDVDEGVQMVNETNLKGETALMFAVARLDVAIVRILLNRGAHETINEQESSNGNTALMIAVDRMRDPEGADPNKEGRKTIVENLLDRGADVDIRRNTDEWDVLDIAEHHFDKEIQSSLTESSIERRKIVKEALYWTKVVGLPASLLAILQGLFSLIRRLFVQRLKSENEDARESASKFLKRFGGKNVVNSLKKILRTTTSEDVYRNIVEVLSGLEGGGEIVDKQRKADDEVEEKIREKLPGRPHGLDDLIGREDIIRARSLLLRNDDFDVVVHPQTRTTDGGVIPAHIEIKELEEDGLVKSTKLDALNLSTRVKNLLIPAGIGTPWQLSRKSEQQLRMVSGIGDAAIDEIKKALRAKGRTLRGDKKKGRDKALLAESEKEDNALLVGDQDTVGGIDLNEIDVMRQGRGVNVEFDPVMMPNRVQEFDQIKGVTPVIINFVPIQNILPILGLDSQDEEEVLSRL